MNMVKAIIGSKHVMNMVFMKDIRDGNFRSTLTLKDIRDGNFRSTLTLKNKILLINLMWQQKIQFTKGIL
jgi:hypothetical protein